MYLVSWRKVTIRKFKMLYFQNERRYGTGNFYKYSFLGHLQRSIHKNSEDLAILILEFDDVTVKTIYISSRNGPALSFVIFLMFLVSLLKLSKLQEHC